MNNKKRVGPPAIIDFSYFGPIEVKVEGSSREDFERAHGKFKRLFAFDRVLGQLKDRRAYKKPSEKKRLKRRESENKRLMAEAREKMVKSGEWDRRQKVRAQGRVRKDERQAGVYDE